MNHASRRLEDIEEHSDLTEGTKALRAFKHPVETIEPSAVKPLKVLSPETIADLIAELGRALTPVLAFQAKGRLTRTMEMRTWVILRAIRPDLIKDEKIDDAAKRFGVVPSRLFALIKEFQEEIPAYIEPGRKPEQQRQRMSAARRARSSPTPQGIRNLFSETSTSAGSVST